MNALLASSGNDHESGTKPGRFWGVVCWIPVIALVMPLVFAAVAFVRVGHWPYYSNPDPKDLRLPFLHGAALFSYLLAAFSIPACLFVVVSAWVRLRRRDLVAFAVGASLWIFTVPITGRLFDWLID